MSRLHVIALLALSAVALPASTAFAQVIFGPGMGGGQDRSTPGRVTERDDVYTCQAAPGGSRMRENCETETTTTSFRTEHTLEFLIEAPPVLSVQCGASTTTEYRQLNTVARVKSTLAIADCTAASGLFTVELLIRDESGEDRPLEFNETWQRSDDQDVEFTADYPIGEDMELLSTRLRGLTCTCADPAAEDIEGSQVAATPEQPPAE
jgi:hypothetical protein